ncbi:hypothetical protein SELMODRAFT_415128 [Selaginella moellendorffii]|uniref:Uncharacterized protein n=1 Tax=Selaginella moellendorffii TaxID=88036 RepID=D8RV41_SELML|nr:hypothetical protein SELMODRAFT_415128 [Selaginella moellendorffii]
MGQKRPCVMGSRHEEEDQVLITDISTGSVGQKKRQKFLHGLLLYQLVVNNSLFYLKMLIQYSFGVPEFRLPEAPNFPIGSDYSAYVNPVAAHDFLDAIQDVVQQRLFDNIRESLFFSVLVDESVVQRLRMICPKIIGVHCVAHREALAAKDGFTTNQPIFDAIDKLAQKIKSWLGKSSLRHKELKELLQGEVMQWLVIAMPALLDQWKIADKTQYSSLTTIQVQFFIHLLADVLAELNKLNVLFQAQMTNCLEIVSFLDMTIETLKGHKG